MTSTARRTLAGFVLTLTLILALGLAPGLAGAQEGAAPPPAAAGEQQRIGPEGLLRDISALSADSVEGRGPGTPGDRKARGYLIRRLKEVGLQPGAEGGGWEQPITFVGLTVKNFDRWRFAGPAGEAEFRWGDDFIGGSGVQAPRVSIPDAEVVFVGYGIQAPEYKWDDFKGADLKGKILLILNNDPDWDPDLFAGTRRLYYGRWDYKYESAARQGAAAAIILHTVPSAAYGWNVVRRSWSGTQFELPAGDEPRIGFRSWLTEPSVRRLCALGGKDLDSLIAAARRRDFAPIPLGVKTSLAFDVAVVKTPTANVIGVLPGSDPKLRDEAVVFSAHHDHLGIGAPDSTGDRIHNGALDNASGCAQVLAMAEAFAATQPRPGRTVVALFLAGEEQGLLGSKYYVDHPTVPLARLTADLNFDGGNILGRASDVAVIGRGRTDLEDRLVVAARGQGRTVVDEPEPDKGYYYRADQLSFARAGVPALYFKSGQTFIGRPAGWGRQKEAEYVRLHYHQPSDEIRPDWDLSGMVEDARLAYLVGLDVLNGTRRPALKPGDEFESARKKAATLTETQRAWAAKANRHEKAGWIYLHIEGSARERGFQYGYLLAAEISLGIQDVRVGWTHQSSLGWDWLVSKADTLFTAKVDPENLAELDGIVEGLAAAGVASSRAEIIAYNGIIELSGYWWPKYMEKFKASPEPPAKEKCSSFVAVGSMTRDGGVILGHNTMSGYEGVQPNVILDVAPDRGHRVLMQALPGWIHSGTDFFITDAGLVGSETTIGGFEGFDSAGVPEFVRMRRATQDAGSIDQWCEIMKKGNSGGYANAWLLGDVNTREIARLELGLKYVGFEKKRDGWFVGSNLAEDLRILRIETSVKETDIRSSGVARRVRWKQLMAQFAGRIDLEAAKGFEADHFDAYFGRERPGNRSLCAHAELEDAPALPAQIPNEPGGTVDAKVVDSGMARRMSFAARWGSACGIAFDAAGFLAHHPQFEWMKDILRSRPSQPWAEFTAGELK